MGIQKITPNQLTSTGMPSGSVLISDGSGSWNTSVNDIISSSSDMIDFFELVLVALGYDITYEDFSKMSSDEKKAIIRDIKIKRVLDVDNKG